MAATGARQIPSHRDEPDRIVMPGVRRANALRLPARLPHLRRTIGDGAAPSSSVPHARVREGSARSAVRTVRRFVLASSRTRCVRGNRKRAQVR
jgi:hypothetical protein